MISKVVEIKSVKDRTWPNGTIHFFTCKMENGDTINLGKKSADAIQLGSEINYDIVEWPNEYGVCKVKEVREEFKPWAKPWFAKNYEKDSISMALSYAKDLVVWGKVELKDLEKEAERMHVWMVAKYLWFKA